MADTDKGGLINDTFSLIRNETMELNRIFFHFVNIFNLSFINFDYEKKK